MYQITRGYKQGRAVLYYDIEDNLENKTCAMVPKDTIVKMCTDEQISNAKIQWWEGKPIVRCSNKQLPLVRIDDNRNVIGVTTQAVRGTDKTHTENIKHNNKLEVVSNNAVKVGKISTKKYKRNISYGGYDQRNLLEKQEMSRTVDLSGLVTVGDMFDYIAKDFRVQQVDKYRKEFSKKVNIDKKLDSIESVQLKAIQYGAATYLMNMLYDEIADVYLKWQ